MTLGQTDICRDANLRYNMEWSSCGIAGLPSGNGAPPATLTGGSFVVGTPQADENQKLASIKWTDHYYLEKYRDEEAAIEDAKAVLDSEGGAVGLPRLPATSWEQYDQYFEWIQPYVNVDLHAVQPYADWLRDAEVVPEPAINAQDVYSRMDDLIQQILGEENADPSELVDQASQEIERAVQR